MESRNSISGVSSEGSQWSGDITDTERDALPLIAQAHSLMKQVMESYEFVQVSPLQPATLNIDGNVDRPRFMVPYHELLVNAHFTVPQIS